MEKICTCIFITSLLFFLDIGCLKNKKSHLSLTEKFTVKKVSLRDVISQTGEIRPVITIEIKSEASGKIEKIYVKEGQQVVKGDTILIIDTSRLYTQKEKLECSLKKAEINLKINERDYNNGVELVKTGSLSSKKLQDLQLAVELASIEYKQQLLELKDIDEQLSKTVITSPMSGVITSLLVKEGEIAVSATSGFQSGTAIGIVADISKLEVVTTIGEVDYIKIYNGQKVTIRPEAIENAATTGTIHFIALSAKKLENQELSGFEVRIDVDSIISGIAPGVNVNVEFVLLEKNNVVGVPYHFVKKEDSISTIELITRDSFGNLKSVNTIVKTGLTDFKYYEILSGLNEGDTVTFTPDIDK